MSYMEAKMQDQIDGSIALQNTIFDDACDIFKETGIMPLDMKSQRDELLEALQECVSLLEFLETEVRGGYSPDGALNTARAVIARALGEKQ